ncbi:MAG: hypothetical protein GX941_04765, partial [Candidatus Methanofastidiosa archaeon]|nr:hypothetical protein [Candidatus Methanofastidiosa archaeon]
KYASYNNRRYKNALKVKEAKEKNAGDANRRKSRKRKLPRDRASRLLNVLILGVQSFAKSIIDCL